MNQQSSSNRPMVMALWANAVLLLLILVVLVGHNSSLPSFLPSAYGQTQAPIGGGNGVFLVPAQFSVNTWGCYLMDIDAQTLAAYQFFPGEKQLRFIAARNFRYDRKLGRYNTAPDPTEIKDLVEKQQQESRSNPNSTKPSPE